jgi:hypothetical protein
MLDTSRIASGFDVEMQLGGGWFRTALDLLNAHGLLAPPGVPVIITDVRISFEPDWNLEIDVLGLPVPVFANIALDAMDKELILTTSLAGVPERRIPFDVLEDLAGKPELVRLEGDGEHEPVLAVLANLDIKVAPQTEEPEGEFLPRGDVSLAQSFLPRGQHIAFGIGKETYAHFANDLWHTELRAEDGTHPLADADNKMGDWTRVSMTGTDGTLKMVLEGVVPLDSPWIDIVPDGDVTIILRLTPSTSDGKLTFDMEIDEDVDTGLLGDLLAGIIGAFTVGPVTGIILLEIAEVIVEGVVHQKIKAFIDGETPPPDVHCCEAGVVHIATSTGEEGFDLSVLDAIPSSIAVSTQNPENELLYRESLLVTAVYDDLTVDGDGFAVAGSSGTAVKFEPEAASLSSVHHEGEQLASLTYQRAGQRQELSIQEVLVRAAEAELKSPFRIFQKPENADLRRPEGRLPCVCLKPVAIRQEDTIVEEIEFESGLRMRVPDVIALQDAAVLVVTGYQLIHPRDYDAYYRAKADFRTDNNLESLPRF